MNSELERCPWCLGHDEYIAYHDHEWGIPSRDDRHLFEMLILEGAQAGLSWLTILRRRDGYRRAFAGFDAERVAAFDDADRARLLADTGIVRNRAKVDAAIGNAHAFLALREQHGSFSDWAWAFVDGVPVVNSPRSLADVPAQTERSKSMSRELKRRGFRFVGPTIMYAWMQAVGLVNDHLVDCWRHPDRR